MENKKELEEFPSRKKQKEAIKLSSQFLRGSTKSEFKIPAALFLRLFLWPRDPSPVLSLHELRSIAELINK